MCDVVLRVWPVEKKVLCLRPSVMYGQVAQFCPHRKDPSGRLVLLEGVETGNCAVTKMSRRLELRR